MPSFDCTKCKKQTNHYELKQIRNCSFIETAYWRNDFGDKIGGYGFSECKGGILQLNADTIAYIQMLSRKGNPTINLNYLENKAILDYENARDLAFEVKRKAETKSNK